MKAEVRLATEADTEKFVEWVLNTDKNLFDPGIAKYTNLRTLAVDVNGAPRMFVPFHPILMIESLAHPKNPRHIDALCVVRAQEQIEKYAAEYGMAELRFECADAELQKFVENNLGYEVVKTVVLRKRLQR